MAVYSLLGDEEDAAIQVSATGEAEESRTELDSHANMPVLGRHVHILSDTGRKADVSPFTPDYQSLKMPIVDAAIGYMCPVTGEESFLVVRNALHSPNMKNNLLPPFVLREAGLRVNDVPKIHTDDPSVDDHAIVFDVGQQCRRHL